MNIYLHSLALNKLLMSPSPKSQILNYNQETTNQKLWLKSKSDDQVTMLSPNSHTLDQKLHRAPNLNAPSRRLTSSVQFNLWQLWSWCLSLGFERLGLILVDCKSSSDNQVIHPKTKQTAIFCIQTSIDSNIEQRRLIDWIYPLASSSFHVTLELSWAVIMIYQQYYIIKVFQMFLWVKNPIKLLSRLLRKDHDIRRQKVEQLEKNISSSSECI